MELDRQTIEKRDFPIGRRGYDPAAVDAHLRALASEVEELRRALDSRTGESLGSSAGTQVQGILEAAEATAADIEQKASEDARRTRAEADSDAERTRADAVKQARAHVAAVGRATEVLIERVESMDGEASILVDSLRAGAGRLGNDLTAVETNMAELYDAASGRTGDASRVDPQNQGPPAAAAVAAGGSGLAAPVVQGHAEFVPATAPPVASSPATASSPAIVPDPATPPDAPVTPTPPFLAPSSPRPSQSIPQAGGGKDDLDGARLIALNMALNGDSRAATDRYLAEHYELGDRQKLLDEVYAAIEG